MYKMCIVVDVVVSAGRYSHLHFVTSADFESRSSGFADRAEMMTAEQNKRKYTTSPRPLDTIANINRYSVYIYMIYAYYGPIR